MVLERLNNWFKLSKQYFFVYKEGFFNLTYLSNSPELIINSSIKMPFMKVNKETQTLHLDTPFLKGTCNYAELEDGLWILNSKMDYKNNVSFQPVYDSFLPTNYFCVTINYVESEFNSSFFESNSYQVANQSISFVSPGADFLHCHFKGSKTNMYVIYFSEAWVDKNLITVSSVKKQEKSFLNYKYDESLFSTIVNNFEQTYNIELKPNNFELKNNTYSFLDVFFKNIDTIESYKNISLGLKDHLKIEKVEHYLISNLFAKFVGIDQLSIKFGISPTKLKKDFKNVFGSSVFQYYQSKQMEMANILLIENKLLIKDIAVKFGYENVSKFSRAFQKKYNKLPSQINL